jgi:hypothetical protein
MSKQRTDGRTTWSSAAGRLPRELQGTGLAVAAALDRLMQEGDVSVAVSETRSAEAMRAAAYAMGYRDGADVEECGKLSVGEARKELIAVMKTLRGLGQSVVCAQQIALSEGVRAARGGQVLSTSAPTTSVEGEQTVRVQVGQH